MEKNKKFLVTVATIMLIALTSFPVYANETQFTGKSVDSNSYTHICYATKTAAGTYGEVKVTDILKADGTASNYTYVYARATASGTARLIKKGSWFELDIPSGYTSAGSYVSLRCKGVNPAVDCKISGYWNVH